MGTKLPGQLESEFDEKDGWAWNAMDTRVSWTRKSAWSYRFRTFGCVSTKVSKRWQHISNK